MNQSITSQKSKDKVLLIFFFMSFFKQIIIKHMTSERSLSAGKFCIQQVQASTPRHLKHRRKISNLENKILFFEGQVDPLHLENKSLKQQLTALTRISSISTDIFRGLLSPHYDAPRKLKLQLAGMLQIADMVRQDWLSMQQIMASDKATIQRLTEQSTEWQTKYINENNQRQKQIRQLEESKLRMKNQHEKFVMRAHQELQETLKKHKQQKQAIKLFYEKKLALYENGIQDYERFKKTTQDKDNEYQRLIQRLKDEIAANLVSFEQGKKNIKEIYDKLMTDRLAEQAEGYELVMKMKEQQKLSILTLMSEAQDQHKRQLALKEYEISRLNQAKTTLKQQIGSLKDDIWSKKLTIDKYIAQEKSLQEKIKTANAFAQNLLEKIDKKTRQNQHQKKQYEFRIKKQQIEMDAIKKDSSKAMAMLIEEKEKITAELQTLSQKYKQTCGAMVKMEAQNNQKINKLKEQFSLIQQELKNNLASTNLKLDQQTKLYNSLRLENEEIIKQNEQNVRKLQQQHKQKYQEMMYRYDKKLSSLQLQKEQQLQAMQKRHESEMREATIAANEQMRQMMIDCNKKLAAQAEQYLQKIEQIKQEEQNLKAIIKTQEKQISKHIEDTQLLKLKHIQQMKALQNQNEIQRQNFHKQLDRQMLQFQKSLEQKQLQLSLARQSNGLDQLQAKYISQIQILKKDFQQKTQMMHNQFDSEYTRLQEAKRQTIGQLIESHKENMTSLSTTYNEHLTKIAEKAQEHESKLSNKLLNNLSPEIQGSTPQQKIQFISSKITELKQSGIEKDEHIQTLEKNLNKLQNEFEDRIKVKKEELEIEKNIAIKKCNETVAKNISECKARVQEVEKSRIDHAKLMHKDFLDIKEAHEQQIEQLMLRYQQLEKLFSERPSRMEDLNKIKELINIQAQKQYQIQGYQKRMQTANEIVKYLNLELQNYKDAYDIFGPQDNNKGQISLVGHSMGKSPQARSYSDTLQIMEILKFKKNQRKEDESKMEERKSTSKQALSFRKLNQTPAVKQLKLFQQNDESQQLEAQFKPYHSPKHEHRYSNLIQNKPQKRQRIKTEKVQKQYEQTQIIDRAQNFIKMLKRGELTNHVIRQETDIIKKPAYRKRKVNKKSTVGLSNYI